MRENIFAPILERNTVIPASRERSFSPMDDRQRVVQFNVYQGESPNCLDNVLLGKIEVPVPPGRATQVAVNCRFTYDINGLLEVDVVVPETGQQRQLVIVDEEAPMDEAALNTRRQELAKLKVHPREQDENRALVARATRCYEGALGERREYIARLMSEFQSVVDAQDPRSIEAAREEITRHLDAIEGETYL
jgi:molecular chaperone HscC